MPVGHICREINIAARHVRRALKHHFRNPQAMRADGSLTINGKLPISKATRPEDSDPHNHWFFRPSSDEGIADILYRAHNVPEIIAAIENHLRHE